MTSISVIHLARLPPAFIKDRVVTMFSKLCATFSYSGEVPEDVEILIGELTQLEKKKYPNLKLVIIPHAGVTLPPSTAKTITTQYPSLPILTLHRNAVPTAETGVALLLAAAKQLVIADRDLRVGNWASSSFANGASGTEVTMSQVVLRKKRVLVLGYGRIGRSVAMACTGLGMEVVGIRNRITAEYEDDLGTKVYPLSSLESLLPTCTVLFCTLPGTHHTLGLIDRHKLSLLPPQAIVVNIGRGAVFVERDLFEALQSKQLFGAGLDVWWSYPPRDEPEKAANWPPSEFDFSSLENVVMSPHRGGGLHTPEVEVQRYDELEEIVEDIIKKGWDTVWDHQNIFDISLGY